ncbi:type IV secretory system conjugative DNA transfer family protein [Streptococcus constellatus]
MISRKRQHSDGIEAFLSKKALDLGIHSPAPLPLISPPHLACFGTSGSGKTYASKLLLAKISKYFNSCCVIADYKSDIDFEFLKNEDFCFRYREVGRWFDLGIHLLSNRQLGIDPLRIPIVLFQDEMAAYLTSLTKKERDERIHQLSQLLMLGRSFNIFVWISQQRPDSEYFGKARDNIGSKIVLGKISKEVLNMVFPDNKEEVTAQNPRGIGYVTIDGRGTEQIVCPKYNVAKAEQTILQAVRRTAQYYSLQALLGEEDGAGEA